MLGKKKDTNYTVLAVPLQLMKVNVVQAEHKQILASAAQ